MKHIAILLCVLAWPAAAAAQVNIAALSATELVEQYPGTARMMVFSTCPAVNARHDSIFVALLDAARTDEVRRLLALLQPANRRRCNDERMNRWVRAQLAAMQDPAGALEILKHIIRAGADEADKAAIRDWLLSGRLPDFRLDQGLQLVTRGDAYAPTPFTLQERSDLLIAAYDRVELPLLHLRSEFVHLHAAGLADRLREALLDALVRNPRAPSAMHVAIALGLDLDASGRTDSPAWRARFLAAMEQLERAPSGEVPAGVMLHVRNNLLWLRPRP